METRAPPGEVGGGFKKSLCDPGEGTEESHSGSAPPLPGIKRPRKDSPAAEAAAPARGRVNRGDPAEARSARRETSRGGTRPAGASTGGRRTCHNPWGVSARVEGLGFTSTSRAVRETEPSNPPP